MLNYFEKKILQRKKILWKKYFQIFSNIREYLKNFGMKFSKSINLLDMHVLKLPPVLQ